MKASCPPRRGFIAAVIGLGATLVLLARDFSHTKEKVTIPASFVHEADVVNVSRAALNGDASGNTILNPDGSTMVILDTKTGSEILDDDLDLKDVGFPTKALSPNELRLCDTATTIQLQGRQLSCESDPSCLKCAQATTHIEKAIEAIKTGSAVIMEGLRPRDHQKKTRKTFPKNFVVLVPLEKAGIEAWSKLYGCKTNRTFTSIIAVMDKPSEEAARGKGFPTIPAYSWLPPASVVGEGSEILTFITIITLASEILKVGRSVVWCPPTADVYQDTRFDRLVLTAYHRDILTVPEHYAPLQSSNPLFVTDDVSLSNPGFGIVVNNQRTRIFMESVVGALVLSKVGQGHASLWDAMLRYYKFRQIDVRALPAKVVGPLIITKPGTSGTSCAA